MRFFIMGFVLAAATGAGVIYARSEPPPPAQPIAFSHAIHKKKDVECLDCHKQAQTGRAATIPGIDVCMGCHSDALTQSPEEAKLRAIAASKKPLEWVRVTSVPEHVLFSHGRHVGIAKIACDACHGAIGTSERPPEAPASKPAMDAFCIACHAKEGAKTSCLECHR